MSNYSVEKIGNPKKKPKTRLMYWEWKLYQI